MDKALKGMRARNECSDGNQEEEAIAYCKQWLLQISMNYVDVAV